MGLLKDGYRVMALFDPHIQTKPSGTTGWRPAVSPALETALRFGEFWKPDEVITGQDFMEFGPISYWNQRNKLDMEGRRLCHDYELANQILDRICAFTQQRVTFIPGNHDFWMTQHIKENPALKGMLDQGLCLHFKERGVFSLEYGQIYRLGKAAFAHELLRNRKTFTTKYHSARMAEDYAKTIFYGHFHTHQAFVKVTHDSKPHAAVAIGCLSDLNPGWIRNSINNWVHQILLLEYDSKGNFTWLAPILINNRFYFDGILFTPQGPRMGSSGRLITPHDNQEPSFQL